MEDGDYVNVLRKLEEYLKDVETLNRSLIAREYWINDQLTVDEDNEGLKELRNEWGETIYMVGTVALLEMEECNPKQTESIPVLLELMALKSSIEMENTNYEEELKNDRRLVCNLIYEINCRKEKLPQMEREYNEMITTLRGLINGLIAKINSKDSNLWGWELQYNVTVRQLKGKNAALCRAFAECTLDYICNSKRKSWKL
ncbi:hypothetical protein PVK06_036716 [Gossypium arboreum]|uniref:Factor of DNA methylation 1-5/IDN2 domain-containing protein n=1 Tax=Gossypium arboreum TaxID=29729 RepID=A0ABR0NKV6_GOSAR|nr:hypothetical protein PVK06_036716 [Gossypium arboreum]